MPGPYIPPQPRRAQAVRSVGGEARRQWRWLVPLVGLLPVVAVAVLASQIGLVRTGSSPVAGGAVATPATVTAAATATSVPSGAPAATVAAPGQAASGPTPNAVAAPATGTTTTGGTAATPTAQSGSGTATTSATSASSQNTNGGPFVAYRVQPGDSVRFVARMYGVSPASIAQASGLQNADLLRIGQVLTVPTRPGWLYRVQPGETLEQISARTGVASQTILSASGLTMASVGDVVLIPDAAAAPGK